MCVRYGRRRIGEQFISVVDTGNIWRLKQRRCGRGEQITAGTDTASDWLHPRRRGNILTGCGIDVVTQFRKQYEGSNMSRAPWNTISGIFRFYVNGTRIQNNSTQCLGLTVAILRHDPELPATNLSRNADYCKSRLKCFSSVGSGRCRNQTQKFGRRPFLSI